MNQGFFSLLLSVGVLISSDAMAAEHQITSPWGNQPTRVLIGYSSINDMNLIITQRTTDSKCLIYVISETTFAFFAGNGQNVIRALGSGESAKLCKVSLTGLKKNGRIVGGTGSDLIAGGLRIDASGGSGNDTLVATEYGSASISGSHGHDVLISLNGGNDLNGGPGDDTLCVLRSFWTSTFGGTGYDVQAGSSRSSADIEEFQSSAADYCAFDLFVVDLMLSGWK